MTSFILGDQQHSYSLKVFIVFVAAFPTGPSVCWGVVNRLPVLSRTQAVEFPQVLAYNNMLAHGTVTNDDVGLHEHSC